jgi:hypothetical protein
MYIVRNKVTKEILHVNPAPSSQKLTGTQIYHLFDPESMEIGQIESASIPEHFEINDRGQVIELSLGEKVARGIIVLRKDQKIQEGQIVQKTLSEQIADGLISISQRDKIVGEGPEERIVEKTIAELISEDLINLEPHQKVMDGTIVDKTSQELIDEGLLTRDEVKKRTTRRLRREVETFFAVGETESGYSIDNLARQKASFSSQYRPRPNIDEEKRRLLDAGLIYPDAVVDEILAAVKGVTDAYNAAKQAVVTACDAGKPAESWENISLKDHLPEPS